ncbi:prolyl 3-hydroxylase 1-like [Coccinella septempunctata]|uniref:prolyl 3-hydroxylase 1-like n=1 Tax=Coccinella septempunctata TaxID=41139 RepID=UPI001D077690|nr:prolyl 3-hydroxylase 1-like [Coccinella septempunctata]
MTRIRAFSFQSASVFEVVNMHRTTKHFLFKYPMCLNLGAYGSYFATLFLCVILTHVHCDQLNNTKSCVDLYEKGVELYLENNFSECVSYLEKAVTEYHKYRKTLQNCRLACKREAEDSEPLYSVDIDNLMFFEKTIRTTLCAIKCHDKLIGDSASFNINEDIENLFEKKKPYEYLHICYFQTKEIQKAASAVFTYLVSHPNDTTMLSALKYYSSFDGVDLKEVVNFEARDYVYMFSHGLAAYDEKDWKAVIDNMEESLVDFIQAEEECRAQCEGPFDHGWLPDFFPSIANHFTYCLKCKSGCYSKLNSINTEKHEDLLPSHYHYLQYAYYKVGNLRMACEAVASFLLFVPDDETMLSNKEYYMKLPKVEKTFFKPRSEALKYIQRLTYERKLLKFIEKEFNFQTLIPEDSTKRQKPQFIITKAEGELNGTKRFVAEGLMSKEQCKSIRNILKIYSKIGDGYDTGSPHTKNERIEGISMERVILLVHHEILNSKYLEILLEITESAKEEITKYFSIEEPLYHTYTHFVCRTSLKDSVKNHNELSHEIHADNCNIYPDGVCEKEAPSYTWRDFSAIIYLNDDFLGGEFFFSSNMNPDSIQSSVHPRCGKMVAFSSGGENLHGVKAVQKGTRCAIGLWFTLNPGYKENYRDLAYDVIRHNREKNDETYGHNKSS